METKKYLIVIILLQISIVCFAQDSIRVDSEISIETVGQHNLAAQANNFDCFNCLTGKIEDNPLFHLAIYTGIEHKLVLDEKYTLETGIYLEERSQSGGNNTLSNIVVFPKILLEVDDTIKVSNKKIGVKIKGGDLWNEDIGDIIRIYNIDYQGIIGMLSLNKWDASFMSIGDLSRNTGLDLNQTYRFSLGYRNQLIRNLMSFTINELETSPIGRHPTSSDLNISNYTKFNLSSGFNIEGQVEVRLNSELSQSVALGMQANYKSNNISLTSSMRYFSSKFNFGYDGKQPRYYGQNGSYVGPQLYPLKNYYRNYSQWAAYTQISSSDLIAIAFSSKWDKTFYKKLGVFYDIDINYVYDVMDDKGYLFPIYNTGLRINFLQNFIVNFSITNKHLELRNFYQTFSVGKVPFLSLGVRMDLNRLHQKTMYIKT